DAWIGNGRIEAGRVTFFDFEDCGHGPLLIDVATQLWHLMLAEDDSESLQRSFLGGYESVRAFEHLERAKLRDFVSIAQARSLLFLSRYCKLKDALWTELAAQARRIC